MTEAKESGYNSVTRYGGTGIQGTEVQCRGARMIVYRMRRLQGLRISWNRNDSGTGTLKVEYTNKRINHKKRRE
jgi:hypothetical protein